MLRYRTTTDQAEQLLQRVEAQAEISAGPPASLTGRRVRLTEDSDEERTRDLERLREQDTYLRSRAERWQEPGAESSSSDVLEEPSPQGENEAQPQPAESAPEVDPSTVVEPARRAEIDPGSVSASRAGSTTVGGSAPWALSVS